MKNDAVFIVILINNKKYSIFIRGNSKILLKYTKIDLNKWQDTPYSCKEIF